MQLGALELTVLDRLWREGELDAKQVHALLHAERPLTLSTVQSTLERLCDKSLVSRTKVSHAYRYRPLLARTELIGRAVQSLWQRLGSDNAAVPVSLFLDLAEQLDADALDQLEALIHSRRAERDSRDGESGS